MPDDQPKQGKPFANPGRRDHRPHLIKFAKEMRRAPTPAERSLWQILRKHRLCGFRFRRQYPVRGFIVDFVCLEVGLAVEADGGQHRERAAMTYDEQRSAVLREVGIEVIRFSHREILKERDAVAATILRELEDRMRRAGVYSRVAGRIVTSPLPGPPPQAGEGGYAGAPTAKPNPFPHEPPMPTTIHAIRFDHVQVNVTDLARARAFYGGVFGLVETPRPESFDFAGCWYRVGDVDLHLVVRAAEPESQRHICLWVRDVQEAAKTIQATGHPIRWDTKYKIRGVDRFFVFDPDGNRVEIQGADGTGTSRWD